MFIQHVLVNICQNKKMAKRKPPYEVNHTKAFSKTYFVNWLFILKWPLSIRIIPINNDEKPSLNLWFIIQIDYSISASSNS